MELKHYVQILRRRWWVVVLVPLIVIIVGGLGYVSRTPAYEATARVSFKRMPDAPIPGEFQYDEYYNYLSSEYAIDDLVEIIKGNVFSERVAEHLIADGVVISVGEVQSMLSASREHRILALTAVSHDAERAIQVARAAQLEIEQNAMRYLINRNGTDRAAIIQAVQIPNEAASDQPRARLLLALAVVVAIGAGIVLAFVVDYFDDRLHDAELASAALRLPVLASTRERRA